MQLTSVCTSAPLSHLFYAVTTANIYTALFSSYVKHVHVSINLTKLRNEEMISTHWLEILHKKKQKSTFMDTTAMRMENERIF